MKIIQEDESELEIETTDTFTGEGTDLFTISIKNKLCNDSSYISLNYDEAFKLRDKLNEWLLY